MLILLVASGNSYMTPQRSWVLAFLRTQFLGLSKEGAPTAAKRVTMYCHRDYDTTATHTPPIAKKAQRSPGETSIHPEMCVVYE